MSKIKFKKIYLIGLSQLILQITIFILGICLNPNSDVIPSNFLEMLTKVQTTNNFQNFIWCFTNNLTVLFIVFWLSYWTFGIIGTLWCANSAFMLGLMVSLSVTIHSWLSVCFMLLELTASIIAMLASTYFMFAKKSKKKYLYEYEYELEKKKREKNILYTLIIIVGISLIAALLESIALSLV